MPSIRFGLVMHKSNKATDSSSVSDNSRAVVSFCILEAVIKIVDDSRTRFGANEVKRDCILAECPRASICNTVAKP